MKTPPTITLIAAIDKNNGLGYKGGLLCHIPSDLQHFKKSTVGKPIIMGNTTFASLGKPLPNRQNIVFSRQVKEDNQVTYVQQVQQALAACETATEIMIIGGESIYNLFLPIADKLLITHIDATFKADVFFPPICLSMWQEVCAVEQLADEANVYSYAIKTYHRRALNDKL